MKKSILILLSVLLVIAASSCALSAPSKSNHSDLPDPSLFRQQDRGDFFIETDDCYYYANDQKIYFSSKDELVFYLLCNKPNCTHNDENCNAYTGFGLGYWNGHLYGAILFGETPYFAQIDLDGSEHKKLVDIEMPTNPAGSSGGGYTFYFHNGYVYYNVRNDGLNAFFQTNLATRKTERVLEDLLRGDTWIRSGFHFIDTKFYFVLWEEDGSYVMYGGDTETWEYRRIRDWPSEIRSWMVEGDTLYYYASDRAIFCEYDLMTGEEKTFSQQDYHGAAANYDGDYIYLTTWDDDEFGNMGLSIFDRNYQFIQRIDYQPNQDLLYVTQDKLIFTDLPSQKATKYLPKSAIGTGEAELLSIEDPYSYR